MLASLVLVKINMKKVEIAPSILSADFLHLKDEILKIKNLGRKYLHLDVMDGHFVNNISFGIPVLKCIDHKFGLINDVHLMIENPSIYIKGFIDAGADIITFHYEAISNDEEIFKLIDLIHSYNKLAGLSIKPKTPVSSIEKFLTKLDLVLVMSVEPGFGGQEFIKESLDKIALLKSLKEMNKNFIIEVDGGINGNTAPSCIKAGADLLVSGSYLYKSKNIKEDYERLLKC